MKEMLISVVLAGLVLAFLPICPIRYGIQKETVNGVVFYPVYGQKFPVSDWKIVFANPRTMEEATNWIKYQPRWFPLLAYDSIGKNFLPIDALPIPRVAPQETSNQATFSVPHCDGITDPVMKLGCELSAIHTAKGWVYHFEGRFRMLSEKTGRP